MIENGILVFIKIGKFVRIMKVNGNVWEKRNDNEIDDIVRLDKFSYCLVLEFFWKVKVVLILVEFKWVLFV